MAFDIYDFTQVGQQGEGSLWSYDNGDAVSTILTAGYFNDAAYAIIAGDTILLPQQGPSVTLDVQSVTSKVAITWDNVKTTPLQINNLWVDRDDGVSIIASGSNSIQINPPAVFVKNVQNLQLIPALL